MKFKNCITSFLFAILSVLTLIPVVPAMAVGSENVAISETSTDVEVASSRFYAQFTGGWDQLRVTTTVTNENGSKVGTVYAGEGVTVLYYNSQTAQIEYSGSGGAKRGYIPTSSLKYGGRYGYLYGATDVGIVLTNSSTYYDTNRAYYAGSVNAGEYVVILSRANGWDYIEYNISGGQRKRAFVPSSSIDHQYGTARTAHYQDKVEFSDGLFIFFTVNSTTRVYAGPNGSSYPDIGSVSPSDNGSMAACAEFTDANGNRMYFIRYHGSTGAWKYGYIYH